ncbi:MAG: hypothetical protein LH615_02375 [Ferruginibacter sp.]|nr:hypothetical protein [Ferruginibacter sp.]
MKSITLLLIIMSMQFSYSQVCEGKIEYNKTSQVAIIGECNYPEATVQKTLKDKPKGMAYKLKSSKDFLIISNAVISSISIKSLQYVFKIAQKKK